MHAYGPAKRLACPMILQTSDEVLDTTKVKPVLFKDARGRRREGGQGATYRGFAAMNLSTAAKDLMRLMLNIELSNLFCD